MVLNRVTPKNKAEEKLFQMTENTDILKKQTKTKPQYSLDFQITKPSNLFSFDTPWELEDEWMLKRTGADV